MRLGTSSTGQLVGCIKTVPRRHACVNMCVKRSWDANCFWLVGWAEAASGFGACLAPVGHMTTEACPSSIQFGAWLLFRLSAQCLYLHSARVSGGLSPQEKLQLAATCSARYPCAEETQETKTSALAFRESRFSASLCVQDWGKECPAGAARRSIALGVWKAHMLLSGWSLGEKGYCVVIHGSE